MENIEEKPKKQYYQQKELQIITENTHDFKFDIEEVINETAHFEEWKKGNQLWYHKISIAPMLDVTNPHWRFLYRLVSKYTVLYTEMIHANALVHQNRLKENLTEVQRHTFTPREHPIVFQLGGSEPELLGEAAKIVEELGYDEINLNCGCPSQKVQCGSFGACLMDEPELVSECMKKMKENAKIPVTVKHRIGIDDCDDFGFMKKFVDDIHTKSGVTHFQVHARKAYLKGLNPSQNRNIPPLIYENVVKLKKEFPHLDISINGGFKSYKMVHDILDEKNNLQGCMIGRWAQENIWNLNDVDRQFYGKENQGYSRREILLIYAEYAERVLKEYPNYSHGILIQPIMPIFNGERGNTHYKRILGDISIRRKFKSFRSLVYTALHNFEQHNIKALDERPPTNDEEAADVLRRYNLYRSSIDKNKELAKNDPETQKKQQQKNDRKMKKLQEKLDRKNKKKQEKLEQQQLQQQQQQQQKNNSEKEQVQDNENKIQNIVKENNNDNSGSNIEQEK